MIYADAAATTKIDPVVAKLYYDKLISCFGNPSSQHNAGQDAYRLLEDSRYSIASSLNCKPENIFFTSGGTESNNWALYNAVKKGNSHVIISAVEHHSVSSFLKSNGYDYSILPVDSDGICAVEDLKRYIKPNTSLISVMAANNETGTIQPISEIAKIAHENELLFHTDAVQYVGHLPFDFSKSGADFVSISGHKFNCPKGIGALIADSAKIKYPYIYGGGQEKGLRSGTLNAPLAAAMACALDIAVNNSFYADKVCSLKNRLRKTLSESIPSLRIISPENNCLPGILNISVPGIKGEALRIYLNLKDICVSTGSACSSGKQERSDTLIAMGLDDDAVNGSIRLSFDSFNTTDDIDTIVFTIKKAVDVL